jgi:Zn-dependent protease/CBS domain-containing protein
MHRARRGSAELENWVWARTVHQQVCMRDGIKLGRIFGVQVTLDLSWIVIFLLVSWNLTMVFATWHPGWPLLESLLLAICAALLFFASVLAHELAHSLVARSYGIPVKEIRLFLFGGVSSLEKEPPSPGAELATTIVGPITSIGFGVVMLVVAGLFAQAVEPAFTPAKATDAIALLGPLPTLLLWLGAINVGVGVFNLIPGFPLDGGRILRAIIWSITGDMRRATIAASVVGQITGWLFVVMGIAMFFGLDLPFFGRGFVSGLWLAFIGWFLTSAARSSYQGVFLHEALDGVSVSQLMRRAPQTLPASTTVGEAVDRWFMHSPDGAFVVIDERGALIGLLTSADVRKLPRTAWRETPVTAVMTAAAELVTTSPSEPAAVALGKLGQRNVEQLPVVLEGTTQIVGLLDRRDVARWLELNLAPARSFGPRRHA